MKEGALEGWRLGEGEGRHLLQNRKAPSSDRCWEFRWG